MFTRKYKNYTGILAALLFSAQATLPLQAQSNGYHGYVSHVRYGWNQWKYQHPKMRTAVVDGGIGTAAGALVGVLSGRGAMHGALVGAASGAGIGLVRSSRTMAEHPAARTVSELGIGGLGLYLAAHHGHGF